MGGSNTAGYMGSSAYGMDPYGGGLYGGGLYGGGLYGGMGMMGMGGMGMMGMGGMGMMGMGMTPEAQRAQMMMFMTSRIMELWGVFSQVMQMTVGSAMQFFGEYVGINQRLGQLEDETMNQEERYLHRRHELKKAWKDIPREQRYQPPRIRGSRPQQPSFARRLIIRLLRHATFLLLAYFLSKYIGKGLGLIDSGKVTNELPGGPLSISSLKS